MIFFFYCIGESFSGSPDSESSLWPPAVRLHIVHIGWAWHSLHKVVGLPSFTTCSQLSICQWMEGWLPCWLQKSFLSSPHPSVLPNLFLSCLSAPSSELAPFPFYFCCHYSDFRGQNQLNYPLELAGRDYLLLSKIRSSTISKDTISYNPTL